MLVGGRRGRRRARPARRRRSGSARRVVYSAYILVSDGDRRARAPARARRRSSAPARRSRLTVGSALLGELHLGELTGAGWAGWRCLAVVSTVAAISLFFAGLERVGPTSASILSTVEPLVTVMLAFLVFGESARPLQLLGGALVLAAVVPATSPRRRPAR